MLETKTRQLQNPSSSSTSSSSSSAAAALIAFKPRQVLLLASKSPPPPPMAKKKQQQQQADDGATIKTLLQQSIIHYFHLNGFSKTLKRFLKETKTEGDSWKSCSLNLEDMCYKYLNNSTDNDTNSKGNGEPGNLGQCEDGTNGKNTTKNAADSQETISKKKKKKRSEDKNNVPDASGPESVDKSMKNAMNSQEVLADNKAEVSLKKQKEKKKKKTEEKPEGAVVGDNDVVGEPTKKDKKKKSKEENGATGTKDSKKRKRLASDENANQGVEGVGTEESKRRKTEGLKESMDVARQGKSDDLCTENGHTGNGEASLGEPRKSDVNHEEEFNSSAKQNSSRKERNGSAEPKTVNAFQRVKIDQVEFKDDRLKDNSYWAKDGAEIGYGAKAQEVLGQVKGRDFRHEKTKKKRGSYRGGLIDLQSHSVKFNYSDEE